ncbi:hypothetical protein A0H81_14436 [Grifola frondosa]|uniref:Uncharacterized protein n=1 Tax=Grifola frondosa TaxID=5627 RepID=A0A1C7LMY2_GRIFR|nr:hypothetical protein A0H81_14436 [Grifola frondosa]
MAIRNKHCATSAMDVSPDTVKRESQVRYISHYPGHSRHTSLLTPLSHFLLVYLTKPPSPWRSSRKLPAISTDVHGRAKRSAYFLPRPPLPTPPSRSPTAASATRCPRCRVSEFDKVVCTAAVCALQKEVEVLRQERELLLMREVERFEEIQKLHATIEEVSHAVAAMEAAKARSATFFPAEKYTDSAFEDEDYLYQMKMARMAKYDARSADRAQYIMSPKDKFTALPKRTRRGAVVHERCISDESTSSTLTEATVVNHDDVSVSTTERKSSPIGVVEGERL